MGAWKRWARFGPARIAAAGFVVVLGLCMAIVAGDESAAAPTEATVPAPARSYLARIEPAQRPAGPIRGRTFTFQSVKPCAPSHWGKVKVVERPRTQSHRGIALITAVIEVPAHEEPVLEYGNEYVPIPCVPSLVYMTKRIKLKRPVAGLIVFDRSTSPPTRIWPPRR